MRNKKLVFLQNCLSDQAALSAARGLCALEKEEARLGAPGITKDYFDFTMITDKGVQSISVK